MCCMPTGMRNLLGVVALAMLGIFVVPPVHAAQPVLQRGYDPGLSGANLTETTLNTSSVSPATFGRLFTMPVDDVIYAQPLYVPGVAIPNQGTHNVLYVATMSDTLYAFDADTGTQLWLDDFATSVGATPVPFAQFAFGNSHNIVGNLGILSTPVIDPSTNLLYLLACTLENNTMVYRLHAVNIATGAEPIPGGGTVISATYNGSTFVPTLQTQRVSLTLSGNQVVFGFATMPDEANQPDLYTGWVMAYNKATLIQSGTFATVTSGTTRGGGVWQSGRPPVIDSSGYAYVFVGNGFSTSPYDGVNNFNESALKLNPAAGLTLSDWFTPSNWATLDAGDQDVASSGPMLIPGTSPGLIVGGGKRGLLYVLNTANMGKETVNDSGAAQELQVSPPPDEIHGGTVFWQRSTANGGPLLYIWDALDVLKAYPFNGTTFAATPSAQATGTPPTWPGGILTLSANADTPGTGVLWANVVTSGDPQDAPPSLAGLYAFDANNVAHELWDSTMNSARDNLGLYAKFVPPLVANGKVYMATWGDEVVVYGLLASTYTVSPATLVFGSQQTNSASAALPVTVTNTGGVALSITGISLSNSGTQPFSQTNNCGTSVAIGQTCTISVVFNPATAGPATATLSVNAVTGAGTQQTVALSGTGVAPPAYTVLPASVGFANQLTNVASAPSPVTVTNTGTVPLPVTSITLAGANAAAFSQTSTCGSSVAVGASCAISVVFDPTSVGSNTATLNVNAGVKPVTVNVSGNGVFAVSLTASSANVTAGVPITLTWASTPGAVCTASGGTPADTWTGTLAASGTRAVTEASSGVYHYGLTCVSNGIGVTATAVTVTVTVPTVTLAAAPTSVVVGKPVALTWTATNAATCVASGGQTGDGWAGTKALSGTANVTPTSTGTIIYTMTCSSGPKSAQATAQVIATSSTSSSSSSGHGGGGALDKMSLLSLLMIIGLRCRRTAAAH